VPLVLVAALVAFVVLRLRRDKADGSGGRELEAGRRVLLGLVLLVAAALAFIGAVLGSALGAGVVVAAVVIAVGVGLVGGAFTAQGARWLIVPAVALIVPLGVVAAADLEVKGPWGERTWRPATTAELADGFEMGVGQMNVDLRGIAVPAGRTVVPLELGVGEMRVLVPPGTCVTADARIGGGATNITGDEEGGLDVHVVDRPALPPGTHELHLDTRVGLGAVHVADDARGFHRDWRFDTDVPVSAACGVAG
jgi:hypothetical protein